MIIPDQSHINRIRDALWQSPESCASVMVGAGFSRNAKKAGPYAREIPLWKDIVELLCTRLYPPGDGDNLNRAMIEASSGTSGFLRLAQEYEAAFGRVALQNLIQEIVPDDDYIPGDMHVRLLRLPWRDVFTTNWDTLLERSRLLVADRAYGVVQTFGGIPSVPRPRIFKLHGSLPAQFPFIFTEEDYRTYPKRFAPYVNTVQQAMMETVFCLIGFSGDDPNFLHWSGWVRDNLSEMAPKIYLAGWLNLSSHRRRMLEERNVVPIDVAFHPKASTWPEHLRHQYANEWILYTLEYGQPYEVAEWPSPPGWIHTPIPEIFQPVEKVMVNAPLKEPRPHEKEGGTTNQQEKVRNIIRAWVHNRKVYPGWLIMPPSKNFLIEFNLHDWEQKIFQELPEFPLLERLLVIQELVWKRENLLEPLSEPLEIAARTVLNNIDCQNRKIDGIEDHSLKWTEIREVWRNLNLALLTMARHKFDRETFDHRLDALQPFLEDHPDVAQRAYHEKCLWALYELDFAALDQLLKDWLTENCDPIWMSRKAAILFEMDRKDEAIRLLNNAMSIIREAPKFQHNLASPSREGWILLMVLAFNYGHSKLRDRAMIVTSAFSRWKQLAILQCDAFSQKQEFLRALKGDPEKQDAPLFDLFVRRGTTIRFSNAEYKRQIAAFRAIRLCEVAGLPPSVSHVFNVVVASDLLTLSAENLATTNQALASRLVLRVAGDIEDATFNHVWARYRIAIMTMEDVEVLVDLVTKLISYTLPKINFGQKPSKFWETRLSIAMEALSRLVLRLPPEHTEKIFKNALSNYYRMESIAKCHALHKPLDHLLTRSWEALPKSQRANLVLDILNAPIVGLDGFDGFDNNYPDPGLLLVDNQEIPIPTRSPENENRWSEIIHLVSRALGKAGKARRRATIRLIPLNSWGLVSDSEKNLLAEALWHADHTSPGSLPRGTSLNDGHFLLLPEPFPGRAEQLFRKKWFTSQEPKNNKEFNNFFWKLGSALKSLRKFHKPLSITDEERDLLAAIVEKWIKINTPIIKPVTHEEITGLQSILYEIDLAPTVANALFDIIIPFDQRHFPCYRLFGSIVKFLPDKLDEITRLLRIGLASDNVNQAEDAILGLFDWFRAASENESSDLLPPEDVLFEVGVIIATRRKGILHQALQVARWIFSSGYANQRDTIAQSTLHGLRYLIEELAYNRDHDEKDEVDIPLLRWGCAHLALAMSASGYETDPTVKRWAGVAMNDPLPEVRHAESPASACTNKGKSAVS